MTDAPPCDFRRQLSAAIYRKRSLGGLNRPLFDLRPSSFFLFFLALPVIYRSFDVENLSSRSCVSLLAVSHFFPRPPDCAGWCLLLIHLLLEAVRPVAARSQTLVPPLSASFPENVAPFEKNQAAQGGSRHSQKPKTPTKSHRWDFVHLTFGMMFRLK